MPMITQRTRRYDQTAFWTQMASLYVIVTSLEPDVWITLSETNRLSPRYLKTPGHETI